MCLRLRRRGSSNLCCYHFLFVVVFFLSAGGGCEAAVNARTRCGWVRFRECGELLYGRFPLTPKGAVY